MTLAGFTPTGTLVVRSGEAFALPLILQNANGETQDLLGRSFVLSFRLSRASIALIEIAGVLALDHMSAAFGVTATQATAIYEAGVARALRGEITETGGTFRYSFPVSVDEGSGVPSDEPVSLADLQVTELLAGTAAVIVRERGAQGYGAERRLYDEGYIDEPTVEAMDERYAEAGAPYVAEAAGYAADAEAAKIDAESVLAETESVLAETEAILAETEAVRDAALASGNYYLSTAAGIAATVDGEFFFVVTSGDNAISLYENENEVATLRATLTAQSVVDALNIAIVPETLSDAGIDPDNLATWEIDEHGLTMAGRKIEFGDVTMNDVAQDGLVLYDPDGLVIVEIDGTDADATTTGASDTSYAARDAANVAFAQAGANDLMPMVQQIVRGKVNIILTYGQSLDRSSRGYPPLTVAQPTYADGHVYSLGQACHPTHSTSTTYGPLTSGAIYPLLAVAHNDAGTILDHAALAGIGPDTAVPGEGSAISATYWLRQQWLAKMGLEEDATTPFILLSCGVGGQSLASLSKGASPEYYNRVISGLTQIRDHPTFAGKEFVVSLIKFTQGEQNYAVVETGVHDTVDRYMTGVQQLRSDLIADIETIFANNQKPPAFFLSQTSGQFTTDATNLHVGAAQMRLCTEVDAFFPVTPNYPVVDVTSAHPDNNGYRWLGQYEGRAWSQVLVHGRRPNIVYPRRATWEAATNEIIIDLCSTGGPVLEGQPWDGFAQAALANRGISAKSGSTVVALTDVRLVGAMTIAATPAVALSAPPLVQIGTKANSNGYTGLRCASRQVAPEVYTFVANAGQDPAADIPALNGKPYNLDDWCWCASMQAEQI